MAEIDRYHPDDQRGVDALSRRVLGASAADLNRFRWNWQYAGNPASDGSRPPVWVAREGPSVIGCCGSIPVGLSVRGRTAHASFITGVVVAPERQLQELDARLVRTWEQASDVACAAGTPPPAVSLLQSLGWPEAVAIPYLVKPLSRRAVRRASWPRAVNRLLSAVTHPVVRVIARAKPLPQHVDAIRRFDPGFTALWEALAPKFDLAVRRDVPYLDWRYGEPPHVRYGIAAIEREGRPQGYIVYRHVQQPIGRVTHIVDFLADPEDELGVKTLLRWVDAEARRADSDKIRAWTTCGAFRQIMRRSGYFSVRSKLTLMLKANDPALGVDLRGTDTDRWHVTLGDAELCS